MNAEDWFEDCDIKSKLQNIIDEINVLQAHDTPDKTSLEVFTAGLRRIVESAHHFPDVTPLLINTILDAETDGECLNDLFRNAFNAVANKNFSSSYELTKLEYRENNHKVVVDFEDRET